jgi:hypothetical protein
MPWSIENNRDRIILKMQGNVVEAVYITQHYPQDDPRSKQNDPDNTFLLSVLLLRGTQSRSNNWGDSVSVFLYAAGYNTHSRSFSETYPIREFTNQLCGGTCSNTQHTQVVNHMECLDIKLEVRSTENWNNGHARIRCANVPWSLLGVGMMVALYADNKMTSVTPLGMCSYGSFDANVYLNPGLQVRLLINLPSVIMMTLTGGFLLTYLHLTLMSVCSSTL